MSKLNSTVKIIDGKVVFSTEVLSYFENLRTEENSEWIDKYFDVLSNPLNLDAEKYNIHHIRPCNTFKDETHKNRSETQDLGDAFNGNLIKLSIYNHIKAHYFLWKIFDDFDSKCSIMYVCGLKTNIDDLSEDELDKIALIKEECAKKNKTKEDTRQYKKKYNQENKDKKSKWDANYKKKHAEDIAKRRQENKERYDKQSKEHSEQKCFDPKENDICTLRALQKRKRRHVEKYKDVIPNDCIFKTEEEYLQKQKELDDIEKIKPSKIYANQQCYDPKENNFCTFNALCKRKRTYSEKYKDVIPNKCIIKTEEEYLQKKMEYEKYESERKKVQKERCDKNKKRCSENSKRYYEKHKEERQEKNKEYAKTHKKEISAYKREFNARLCYDPKENDYCALSALYSRKHANKEKYKDVIPKDCVVKK